MKEHAEKETATGTGALCQVCKEKVPKYTCPGCERKTCSLECVQEHKKQYSCTGKRDRTSFVKREDLSHKTLISDYKLLEEVERIDDVAKRSQPPVPRRQLPAYLKSLVYQATCRGVDLRLVAPGMKKRKDNTTRYDGRSQTLSWRIEWRFQTDVSPQQQQGDTIVRHNSRVHEQTILQTILDEHLQHLFQGEIPPCEVYMRQEGLPANEAALLPVDMSSTLGAFLKGKVIIEYPVLLCITKNIPDK
ncbi:hypothetical protein M9434_003835 [Picochlorum sp. BPE23]|nr:hypothetical protein M9434_003835 [Picochlorum sp. BPE23]